MKPEFDWVKARTACSSTAVFEKLKLSVKNDAEIRTAALLGTC
jgi:hypothetical protein